MSVQFTINDRPLEALPGSTILQAARAAGIAIPTLCDYPGLPPHGSCRMCIVEIEGKHVTPTACTTPVEPGMVIHTDSPRVLELRRELLQMLLADHPTSCLFCPERTRCDECMVTLRKSGVTTGCRSCPKDAQCELQVLVEAFGLTQADFPPRYRMLETERGDPFFDRDYNLCILCGRCIRTCEELHFTSALAYTQRGSETVVGTAFGRSHLEAGCSFCGACLAACPTGALSEKTRKWDGAPERETATTCPLCSLGCSIRLLSHGQTVIGSLPDAAAGSPELCVRGRFGITELVNHPTRLVRPTLLWGQNRLGVSWDEALHQAAEKLCACPSGAFQMLISADCSTEDLYIAHKFTRDAVQNGRIAIPGLEHYGAALPQVLRLLAQSQPLAAIDSASAILCLGLEDPYAQSPVEVRLHAARRRGAKILTIDALGHDLNRFADEHLQPRPGLEAGLVQLLRDRILAGFSPEANEAAKGPGGAFERAAALLAEARAPLILLGASSLSGEGAPALLQAVEALAVALSAALILLPVEGNLVGAARVAALFPQPANAAQEPPQVLYQIGASRPCVPAEIEPYVIYQIIYPPQAAPAAGLLLPAAAFSETEGTSTNQAGSMRFFHPAVTPPGEALPSWEILCRMARRMGAQGFEFTSPAQIWAEMDALHPGGWTSLENRTAADTQPASRSHAYLGFPLTRYVEGLRSLYPEEPIG